jgi:hypothetical protein
MKQLNCYFEFNKGHVWVNKKINGYWYKIDSISGVHMINTPSIHKNGYLLLLDRKLLYNEIHYLMLELSTNIDEFEIKAINLYYILKLVKMNKTNDTKYNKKIEILIDIKHKLHHYLENNRLNKNVSLIETHIKECIKIFMDKQI